MKSEGAHPRAHESREERAPERRVISGRLLTTEALVSEIKEKEKAPAGMAGGGGMGGMY